jgi:UDP-N-acetyl-D-mannosaminuronic acid dehydrogenase
MQRVLGGLEGVPVLVLGLTYREGVKELAYSRALPLIDRLAFQGAEVSAYDPLLSSSEVARLGATPWEWGESGPFRAIVTHTGDALWQELDTSWFPDLELLFDGRNSLRDLALPDRVQYAGVGMGRDRRPRTVEAGTA